MDKPVMNVAVYSSREHSRYISVLLTSIYENNPNVLVHCYVIHDKWTSEDEGPLAKYVHDRGHKITFIKVNNDSFLDFPQPPLFWPRSFFGRVLLHFVLPGHLERVLMLGTDVIVNKDIWDFYNSDFEGNYLIGGASRPIARLGEKIKPDRTKTPASVNWISTDITLWNLKAMRENVSRDYYTDFLAEEREWMEDEVLINFTMWDKIKLADAKQYNYSYRAMALYNALLSLTSKADYPAIIHYQVLPKPWDILMTEDEVKFVEKYPALFKKEYPPVFTEYSNRLCAIWWEYAKMTPFYDELFREMELKKSVMLGLVPLVYWTQIKFEREIFYGDLYRNIVNLPDFPKLLAEYFAKNNVKSVAIYGYSEAAQLLERYLSEIDGGLLRYIIDQNPINHPNVRWVASKSEAFEPVDLVIVTALQAYENIKTAMAEKIGCPMVSFLEISQEIYDELNPK